jgi:hypothetical protein
MSTKSIHLGDSQSPRTRPNPPPWSVRTRAILATLVLLAVAYVLWHLFRSEPPVPIPDTPIVPIPAP